MTLARIEQIEDRIKTWREFCWQAYLWMDYKDALAPNMAREYAMCAKRAYDALERAIREAREE